MTLRSSLSGSSCPPAACSLRGGGEIIVLRPRLVLAKDGATIRLYEIIDGSNAGDRDQLGEWIDAKLDLEFGNEKSQVERAEPERCVELVRSVERTDLTETLLQHRPNLGVHESFDLPRRAWFQHLTPPSTTGVRAVMKDAFLDIGKQTAFATACAQMRGARGVRPTLCCCSPVRPFTISLSK
jgi:hypothetical protein